MDNNKEAEGFVKEIEKVEEEIRTRVNSDSTHGITPDSTNIAQDTPKRSMTIADTTASSILDPNVYLQMKSIANDFFQSRAAPSSYQNFYQVLFALQAGHEMGIPPVESLQSLVIINGNLSLWGKAIPKRLRLHGWKIQYEDGGSDDDQYCKAAITNVYTNEEYSETVTFKEASDSGYTLDKSRNLKPGWKPGLNRRLKLRYDALDVLCKSYVPEVFGPTAGTAEVLMDVPAEDIKVETTQDKINAAVGQVELDTSAKAKAV